MIMDLTQPETTSETPDSYSLRTPWATSEREDFYALQDMPKIRRQNQKLHSTSAELTYSDLKNRGIEDRLKFKLRFITRFSYFKWHYLALKYDLLQGLAILLDEIV